MVNKVVIDDIISKMALGKYGAINEAGPTTIVYYVVKFLSGPYTLQEDQTTDEKISKSGELVFKSEYLIIMKAKKLTLSTKLNKTECHHVNP